MKITKSRLAELVREVIQEEKAEYEKFFRAMLKKHGVSSPAELSDEEKREFFNQVDSQYKAKNESLKGDQHELDVDGDGDIEADDLADLRAGKKAKNESADCGCGCGGCSESVNESQVINKKTGKDITKHVLDLLAGKIDQKQFEKLTGLKKESVNEEFKSKDSTFEKVYNIFDKKDYFNAKGLAKTQIGNFERALQKNDKGAKQILNNFKGDVDKAKEYITQVISDRKKEHAFNDYKALKGAVDSIQRGKPEQGAVNYVKRIIHNNNQKYSIALYSALRNQKFTKWKDIHADIDSLIGESVTEGRAFVQAARKAKEEGKTEFEFNGKTYPVTLKD